MISLPNNWHIFVRAFSNILKLINWIFLILWKNCYYEGMQKDRNVAKKCICIFLFPKSSKHSLEKIDFF